MNVQKYKECVLVSRDIFFLSVMSSIECVTDVVVVVIVTSLDTFNDNDPKDMKEKKG